MPICCVFVFCCSFPYYVSAVPPNENNSVATKLASSEESSKNCNGVVLSGVPAALTEAKINHLLKSPASVHSKEDRHNDWKVRPGYSSGASSYTGSDFGEEVEEDALTASMRSASRSNILDLMKLKEEMKEKGDIASTVVRIEVRECCND